MIRRILIGVCTACNFIERSIENEQREESSLVESFAFSGLF